MSFAIHGLGTAHPPAALTPDDGLGVARVLAGPDVRTSTWLGPVYANSGANRRYQVLGGALVQDLLTGTRASGSPFLPTPENEGVGPTTAERMTIYAREAPPLALAASRAALAESEFAPESITHLVTVSCTGFAAPGVDFALITGLGLRPTVARTHVGFMGCHGALNGLRVANAFASADPRARVLVCAVELSSLHYYYGCAADKLIANAIFADGAAAVVGAGLGARPAEVISGASRGPTPPAPLPTGRGEKEPSESSSEPGAQTALSFSPLPAGRGAGGVGPLSASSSLPARGGSDSPLPAGRGAGGVGPRHAPLTLLASGSCLIPNSAADMSWTVGDHGFEMGLSRRVPGQIAAHLRPWLESWLAEHGFALTDVRNWAVHPGGPKIVSAVQECLGLTEADLAPSRAIFAEYGNMSSPTVLFILQRLRAANATRPCVALGFGPGLVAEAALFV